MPKLISLICIVFLAACTPRGNIILDPSAAEIGEIHPVFIGTTRNPDTEKGFGSERSSQLRFARYDISVPVTHESGRIEWPRNTPDPLKNFVASGQELYIDQTAFSGALSREIRSRPPGERTVSVFVHGFNNTFADGVYRLAQMKHDFGFADVAVHYSWPSFGHPLGYAYDRDSMLFARDGLEQLLKVVKASGAEKIQLIGHSMGGLLSMEALRQMAVSDPRAVQNTLSAVVLISPDIDVEVFRQQVSRMGKLPQPFVIIASGRDRALQLSSLITSRQERLGSLTHVQKISDLEVTIVDVTQLVDGGIGHFEAATSPQLVRLLSGMRGVVQSFRNDPTGHAGLIPGTVLIVQNATEIILSPLIQ